MPSKTSLDNLASFIRQLDAEALSSVLIELAADHAAVHERLVRLQLSSQPKALATVFRKKLAAWKRSTKYVDYSQVGEFGRELHAWLEQVEHELMPRDPAEALALAEAFIQGDEVFFNRADDSSGCRRRCDPRGMRDVAEGCLALREPCERLARSHRDPVRGRPIRCPRGVVAPL